MHPLLCSKCCLAWILTYTEREGGREREGARRRRGSDAPFVSCDIDYCFSSSLSQFLSGNPLLHFLCNICSHLGSWTQSMTWDKVSWMSQLMSGTNVSMHVSMPKRDILNIWFDSVNRMLTFSLLIFVTIWSKPVLLHVKYIRVAVFLIWYISQCKVVTRLRCGGRYLLQVTLIDVT